MITGSGLFYNFKFKEPAKSSREIEYKVKCKSCQVHYKNEEGKTVKNKVDGQWNYSFTGELDQFVYVSATLKKKGQKAKIKVMRDGEKVATIKTSSLMSPAKAGVILFR